VEGIRATHRRASPNHILLEEIARLVRVTYVLESLGGILARLAEQDLVTARVLD
jgi:hypothetical protein